MIWTMALALTTWGTANLVCDLNGNNGGINLYGYVSQSPQCLRTHSDCNQISHLRTPLPKPPGAGRKDGGPTGGGGPGAGGEGVEGIHSTGQKMHFAARRRFRRLDL